MRNYICYLNGVSSCGKTSIAKEMLKRIDEKTIYLSLDNIHENLNDKFNNDEWRLYRQEVFGLHRTANIWYNLGFNVIIDCVLAQKVLWDDAVKVVGNSFFVGVFAPLNVVLQREEKRGRKDFALVRRQFNITHQQLDKYSLMIDSSHNTPDKLAEFVIKSITNTIKNESINTKPQSVKVKPDLNAAFNNKRKTEKKEENTKPNPNPIKVKPDLKAAFSNKNTK